MVYHARGNCTIHCIWFSGLSWVLFERGFITSHNGFDHGFDHFWVDINEGDSSKNLGFCHNSSKKIKKTIFPKSLSILHKSFNIRIGWTVSYSANSSRHLFLSTESSRFYYTHLIYLKEMKSLRQPLCLPVVFNPDTIDWESSAITIANSLAIAPLMYDLFGRIKVFWLL